MEELNQQVEQQEKYDGSSIQVLEVWRQCVNALRCISATSR